MRKILLLLGVAAVMLGAGNYAAMKARMAPRSSNGAKTVISTCNGFVCVQLEDSNGKFNIGTSTALGDSTLLYAYPSLPWSSWTMVRVDGVDYCNSAGSGAMPVTHPFSVVSHSGDSSYIYGGWTPGEIDVYQTLMPVYLVYPTSTTGTIFIKYTIVNNTTECHTVGLLLQMDTMMGRNDSAELSTSLGYSGIEEDFFRTDSIFPPYWNAYRSPDGPAFPDSQLVAMGILMGYDAVPPDRFMVGYWVSLYSTTWDYSPDHSDYTDSAVRLWWFPDTLCPGETLIVSTYYGLGRVYRTGQITLNVEPISVVNCTYSPNPFNVLLNFSNLAGMYITGCEATILLPSGMSIAPGYSATQSITPEDLGAGETGATGWQVMIDSYPSVDSLWFEVYSPDLDSIVRASYWLGLPAMAPPPSAFVVSPAYESWSSCPNQNIRINLIADNGLSDDGIIFFLNGDSLDLTDPRLSWANDTLTFVPSTNWSSGETVVFGLLSAVDAMGCSLSTPASGLFYIDTEPPDAHDPEPPADAVLGSTDLDEITLGLTDALRGVDDTTISLRVNDSVYHWGDAPLSYDGSTVHFNLAAAGITPEDGDTFCVDLLTAADPPPDYCAPNRMTSPYSWCFRINIIDLWLPDTVASVGDTLGIPVYIENITNMGIVSFDIAFEYFASNLDFVDVVTTGCVASSWGALTADASDGVLSVSGSGSELSGGGILFIARFVVRAGAAGSYSRLDFTDVSFDDGSLAAAPVNGFLTINWQDFDWLGNLTFITKYGHQRKDIAFGTMASADDGFNSGFDIVSVPPTPSEIDAYFNLDDSTHPYITRLLRDIRNSSDYPIVWTGHGEYYGDSVEVIWHPSSLPDGRIEITFTTTSGSVTLDMHRDTTFTFDGAVDFTIVYDHPVVERNVAVLCPGWNLISFPFIPAGSLTFSEIVPNLLAGGFSYEPTAMTYIYESFPVAGVGYWVYVAAAEAETLRVAGMDVTSLNIAVRRGWNMLGVPNLTAGLAIATSPPGIISESNTYWFDACDSPAHYNVASGSYTPGLGYWFLATDDGTVNMTPALLRGGSDIPKPAIILALTVDGISLVCAADKAASSGLDKMDKLIPPQFPDAAAPPVGLTDGEFLYSEMVKPLADRIDYELSAEAGAGVVVSWNGFSVHGWKAALLDGAARYDMSKAGSALLKGKATVVLERTVPTRLTIVGITPNPFNAFCAIEFSLPENSDVAVDVFSVLGRKVRSLISREMEPGIHKLVWDGTNNNGESMPSDIYFVRLRALGKVRTAKMLLMK